ncbi:MAG TPA: thioesterase domain-containing protein [Steroidobacteraceae bacterium]|nr:thioesterase domain-containing protein [Steroidobacteraceae bacterium]
MTRSTAGAPSLMLPGELAQYVHEHIPLTRAMGVSVVSVEENAVILQAPLAPNINHRHTVFGGSASALAILAGWALLHVRLRVEGIADRLVIQRNTMEYEHPIGGQFTAHATLEHPDRWQSFTAMLARKGKARITVLAVLEQMERVAGRFSGQFVALGAGAGARDEDGA